MMKSKHFKPSLLVFILLLIGAFFWTNMAESTNIYKTISKNLTVLGQIYKEVSKRYVDNVDPEEFLKSGIDGMLNTLDPYTTYIEQEDKHQLEVLTHGKYEGVGLLLNFRNNVVTVGEPPFLGTPAARGGIREGDRIIKVSGVLTKKIGFEETSRRIRGPEGTEVTITIQREGETKLLEFTLVREVIKVDDVRYSGFIKDGIGYIRLTRFSKNAGPEVLQAIQDLNPKNLQGLILDLRSNPGGMLEAAVEVSDLFLSKDLVIVSRRGRAKGSNQVYKSSRGPLYKDKPLAVLVNQFSASASEIVAGAIQDHDRGIVLGDTTFGKGLVQTVVPITPSSALKITTAKYYTPSSRCIQKQNYSAWSDSNAVDRKTIYRTASGRPVHGGGGIAPEIVIHLPRVSDLVLSLRRRSLFFNFAVHYANTHTSLDSNFQVTDEILNEFRQYLKEKAFDYRHPIEHQLSALKEEALERGYEHSLLHNIDLLQNSLNDAKENMFLSSEDDIRKFLKLELTSKFFGIKRAVEVALEDDPVIQKALELLSDEDSYTNVFSVKE